MVLNFSLDNLRALILYNFKLKIYKSQVGLRREHYCRDPLPPLVVACSQKKIVVHPSDCHTMKASSIISRSLHGGLDKQTAFLSVFD
jgi:hypothetical protein